jgi:hypothetical protein
MNKNVFITGMGLCKKTPNKGSSYKLELPRTVKTILKAEELALAATSTAVKQAGSPLSSSCGIIFGVDNAIDGCKSQFFKGLLNDGPLGASPLLFPYTSPNIITAQITIAFTIKGEDITITSGPFSFLKALGYGFELLHRGIMQSAIVGGISENEAMVIMLEALTPRKLRSKKKGKIVLGEIIRHEDCLSGNGVTIGSIEDSFRMMENALKEKDVLHVVCGMSHIKT